MENIKYYKYLIKRKLSRLFGRPESMTAEEILKPCFPINKETEDFLKDKKVKIVGGKNRMLLRTEARQILDKYIKDGIDSGKLKPGNS